MRILTSTQIKHHGKTSHREFDDPSGIVVPAVRRLCQDKIRIYNPKMYFHSGI